MGQISYHRELRGTNMFEHRYGIKLNHVLYSNFPMLMSTNHNIASSWRIENFSLEYSKFSMPKSSSSEPHTVYTFDYVDEPNMDGSGVEDRAKFYLSENQIRVAWTSYESVGNKNWVHFDKHSVQPIINVPSRSFKITCQS